ncbi:MAG: hypothetical protein ACD_19C00187G0002 [uncultured bacterium]|nr:MAG: hypothetical protein ACD_19C00187G0002 [uncultured bacterium]
MFNDIKQKYLIKQTGHLVPMGQITRESFGPSRNETEWLKAKIVSLSGTPSGKISDMYKQLVSLASLPVSNYIDSNRKTWFLNNS